MKLKEIANMNADDWFKKYVVHKETGAGGQINQINVRNWNQSAAPMPVIESVETLDFDRCVITDFSKLPKCEVLFLIDCMVQADHIATDKIEHTLMLIQTKISMDLVLWLLDSNIAIEYTIEYVEGYRFAATTTADGDLRAGIRGHGENWNWVKFDNVFELQDWLLNQPDSGKWFTS